MADRSIWDRMKGAAMLDVATYEEVEHDESLTTQAAIVVLIAALARGVAGFNDGEKGSSSASWRPCSAGWYGPGSRT